MSYYYNYTLGYKGEDGLVYPLGPYDNDGKLKNIISRSASFASDLHEDFMCMPDDMVSDDLRQLFEYTDWNDEKRFDVKYLPLSELPSGSYIQKGYFLINDVQLYEKRGDAWDLFCDNLSPDVYAAKAANEARFGPPQKQTDEEGYNVTPEPASSYMYYAFPDYDSKEFEAFVIRNVAGILDPYERKEIIVLETEG